MKGLWFNSDNIYNKGHKCGEKKLFYIECEEEEQKEHEPMQGYKLEGITPTIYFHALVGINTPKTLKIIGYIKNKMVMMLIDSGSTHNSLTIK